MKGHVIEATLEHCRYLAPRLRPEDKAECMAAFGGAPELALPVGLHVSEQCWTMIGRDGNPFGIFGVSAGQSDVDRSIWMLATPEIATHSVQFLRESRAWVDEVNKIYPVLHNWVDSRNTLHVRWLRWLGCIFINKGPLVPGGPDFINFVRIHDVSSNGSDGRHSPSCRGGTGRHAVPGPVRCG